MPGRSVAIVNPNASRLREPGARAALLAGLRDALAGRDGALPEIVVTDGPGGTRPAVEAAIADGARAVVGAGGDGTLREIAGILRGSGIPMGIVPGGTGNQLAAVLGIPLDLADATRALVDAHPRTIDLGEITIDPVDGPPVTDLFTIGCGIGFDARVMATTPSAAKQRFGKSAYLVQALRLAMTIEAVPYTIEIDGERIETDASVALVGNMGQLVPGAVDLRLPLDPSDGLLDLIVVGARGPVHGAKGLIDQLLRTSLGGGSGSDSIRLRGRRIAIRADRPEPVEVDGDHVGSGSLDAIVLPAAIDVLVPAGA